MNKLPPQPNVRESIVWALQIVQAIADANSSGKKEITVTCGVSAEMRIGQAMETLDQSVDAIQAAGYEVEGRYFHSAGTYDNDSIEFQIRWKDLASNGLR